MYVIDLVEEVWDTIKKIEGDGATDAEVQHALDDTDQIKHAIHDNVFEDSLPHLTRFLGEEVARILEGDCERYHLPLTL